MVRIETDIKKINTQQWSDFVRNHPNGNVFQTPEMYNSYEGLKGYSPRIFVAYQKDEIVGVLLSVLIKESGALKKHFSARSIIIGGPLVVNEDKVYLSELLNAYNSYAKNKAIYTQIRNQSEQLINNDTYQHYGYRFHSHLNFIIPLNGEQNIWERIGKGRGKQIKKAEKNKLHVDVYCNHNEITNELIEDAYKIIQNVYKRAKLPLVDVELMKKANENNLLVLFVVKDENDTMLGCRFCLAYKDCLYGWYAGSFDKYYKLYPNDILIWETLKWGNSNGYLYFDYGGAGEPNKPYGVRAFKQQMGGTLVNYGRYELIHNRILYKIGTLGLKILRLLK